MHITVRMHGELRRVAGRDELFLDFTGSTVENLLDRLVQEFGSEFGRRVFESGVCGLSPGLLILVNGHSVRLLDGMKTKLSDLDDMAVETFEIAETVGGG